MKVLVVRGNRRKNGITEAVTDLFVRGLKSGGAEVCDFNAAHSGIRPCDGCLACASGERKCVHADAMGPLMEKLSKAELLVCATPVYFYSMTSHMKAFWDRCIPFVDGYEKSGDGWRNKTSFEFRRKKFVTINVGSGKFPESYAPLEATWDTIASAMGFEKPFHITRSESLYFRHPNQKLERVRRIKDAIEDAGRQIAETGSIRESTLAAIRQDLSESDEVFVYNSNIYWERLKSSRARFSEIASSDSPNDAQILLGQMCRHFDPRRAPEKATIAFRFGDSKASYRLDIAGGKCTLAEGEGAGADLTIETTQSSWADFINGGAKIIEQLHRGDIVLHGNPHLFTRIKRFFDFSKNARPQALPPPSGSSAGLPPDTAKTK